MESKRFIEVSWKGPYSIDDIERLDSKNGGLYLFTGKKKYERLSDIQYIGITERSYKQRFKEHHKINEVTRDLNIWLGSVSYPLVNARVHLEIAEKILVYYWQCSLNEKLKKYSPKPTVLISKWHKTDGSERIRRVTEVANLPDVICWDGEYWRQGNLKTFCDGY